MVSENKKTNEMSPIITTADWEATSKVQCMEGNTEFGEIYGLRNLS